MTREERLNARLRKRLQATDAPPNDPTAKLHRDLKKPRVREREARLRQPVVKFSKIKASRVPKPRFDAGLASLSKHIDQRLDRDRAERERIELHFRALEAAVSE